MSSARCSGWRRAGRSEVISCSGQADERMRALELPDGRGQGGRQHRRCGEAERELADLARGGALRFRPWPTRTVARMPRARSRKCRPACVRKTRRLSRSNSCTSSSSSSARICVLSGRLRDVEPLGRAREIEFLGDGDEVAQVAKFHDISQVLTNRVQISISKYGSCCLRFLCMETSNTLDAWLDRRRSINAVMARLRAPACRLPALGVRVAAPRTSPGSPRPPATTRSGSTWSTAPCRSMRPAQICATALDIGLVPFVRVPEREYGVIGRLLDGGALGIIAPRIETAEQAADLVAACRFPPLGHRSAIAHAALRGLSQRMPAAQLYAGGEPVDRRQGADRKPAAASRTSEAIARARASTSLGIGTNDLSAELGVRRRVPAPAGARGPRTRAGRMRSAPASR